MVMDIRIDPEFLSLIPPLSTDEYVGLEAQIVADGVRDPLVVWNQGLYCILVDGHNRKDIADRNGLSYQTHSMRFTDRREARIWIRNNQMSRRNLNDARKIDLQLANKAELLEVGKEAMSAGGASKGLSFNDKPSEPVHNTQKAIAKAAGVSTGKVAEAEVIAKKAPDLWEKCKDGEETIGGAYSKLKKQEHAAKQESRRQENAAKVASVQHPTQIIEVGTKFATIVIDPPWECADVGAVNAIGRAKPEYATMTVDALSILPLSDLSDVDCHIYLWITNQMLPLGFDLLEAWGFRYVTAVTWVKPSMGLGNYFRGQTEHVLFGVKGSQKLKRQDVGTVFNAPRGQQGHSSKPVEFYDLVESCSYGPYLEMFSRCERDGWTMWGEDSNE